MKEKSVKKKRYFYEWFWDWVYLHIGVITICIFVILLVGALISYLIFNSIIDYSTLSLYDQIGFPLANSCIFTLAILILALAVTGIISLVSYIHERIDNKKK